MEGFILVGGASSRMGADKSQLDFGGKTAVERIAQVLSPLAARVSVVGARHGDRPGELRNVPDVWQQWGALGGIHAALEACEDDWAAIVACDLPFVTAQLFTRLQQLADEITSERIAAVVPIQPDGRPQPLCALYRPDLCFSETERLIHSGEHTPRALLAAVNTRWVKSNELSDLPGAENFFFNANTPVEYELALRILAADANPDQTQ